MCNCKNVEIQTYTNQVTLLNPYTGGLVCVDACLSDEICELWKSGIETTGCCCGHNKVRPMINVKEKCHLDMVRLGYNYSVNEFNTPCYAPKSVMSKYMERVIEQLCCNATEEYSNQYITYKYTNKQVNSNIGYFERCEKAGMSAYKALLFFRDYLNGDYDI